MTATKTRRQPAARKLTGTQHPTGKSDDRKTVWPNTDEATHRWAANDRSYGLAGSVSFSNGCLRSYSTVVARHCLSKSGNSFVLVTTQRYSVTTSGHVSKARAAVRGRTVFMVPDVLADTVAAHRANLNALRETAVALVTKAKRAITHRAAYLNDANATIVRANQHAEAVGLADRLPIPDDLAAWAARSEEDKATERAKQEKSDRKRHAKAVAEWEQRLAAWKDGNGDRPGECPDHKHPLATVAFLRLRVKNTVLETSMGVAVPVSAALPLLPLIRSGKHYLRYHGSTSPLPGEPEPMPAFDIDGFTPDQIRPVEKTVQIGCHSVTFDECFRIATLLGV